MPGSREAFASFDAGVGACSDPDTFVSVNGNFAEAPWVAGYLREMVAGGLWMFHIWIGVCSRSQPGIFRFTSANRTERNIKFIVRDI